MCSLEHSLSSKISSSAFMGTFYFKGTLQFRQYSYGIRCTFFCNLRFSDFFSTSLGQYINALV